MKQKLRLFTSLLLLAVASVGWGEKYEQLTSIANIDESAQYVLGIDGTGFHYEGTSSWGKTALPSAQTPIYYTLTKASDGNSFTAQATISGTTYYLQVPTSNTFSMATSAGTNTDLIIGTTQVSGTNYAVANKTTTTRHLRINGTSGLRSYAGTTGTMAFFYKVVANGAVITSTTINVPDGFNTDVHTSTIAGQLTATVSANGTVISGATVTWESNNTGVATIDANGNITLVAAGTTTITATYAGVEGQYEGSSATYTLTVIDKTPFEGGDVTFDATVDKGTSPLTKGVVTLSSSNGALDNGTEYRFYKSSQTTISVSEGYYITQIVFTCTAEGQSQYGPGCFSLTNTQPGSYNFEGAIGTWTGSATSVTLTASLNQVRATQVAVTVVQGTPPVAKTDIATINSISPTALTVGDLDEFTLDATFVEGVTASDYTITWESSNTDVLELADATYEAKAAGTANVTVTITPTDIETYNSVSKTFAVTVNAAPVVIGLPFYESFDTNDGTGGNDGSWSGGIASNAFKSVNVGWTQENASGANQCVKAGTGSKKGILTTPELPFVDGKNYVLTFKAAAWNGGSEGTTLTLTASSATLSNAEVTMTKGAWTEYTVYLNDATGAGTVTFAAKNASNNRFFLDEVRIEETNVITVAAPTFSLSQGTYIGEQSVEISCAMEEASIYYTLDGTEPSAQSAIYESAITISENTTLKAIAVKGENVSDVAVAEYTIVVPVHAGTETDPYTTADANLVAAANPKNVYVKGIISNIKSLDVSKYKRAQYYISDNGTEENEFYVFNGYYLNGADFTANDQIQKGDEVVVFGNLTVYNGIKEFAADNYLVSLTRPVTIDATFDENANQASDFADVYNDNVDGNKNVKMLRVFGSDYWNTLVVPFDLTRAQLEEAFGEGVQVAKYTGFKTPANIKFEKTTGDVTRADLLLVKPTATVTNPIFKGVTLEEGKAYTFPEISSSWVDGTLFKIAGRFAKQVLTDDDFGKVYFLNKQGQFTHPTADGNVIRGFRWFIQLKTPESSTGAKIALDVDGDVTSIDAIDNGQFATDAIYNLSGQRVNKAQKGIYIVNGKKVVVK